MDPHPIPSQRNHREIQSPPSLHPRSPEFALFTASADASIRLGDLLASEPLKRRSIIANLSANLIPIVEKGLVDASIAHRRVRARPEGNRLSVPFYFNWLCFIVV